MVRSQELRRCNRSLYGSVIDYVITTYLAEARQCLGLTLRYRTALKA
jgi:hypothetical protein